MLHGSCERAKLNKPRPLYMIFILIIIFFLLDVTGFYSVDCIFLVMVHKNSSFTLSSILFTGQRHFINDSMLRPYEGQTRHAAPQREPGDCALEKVFAPEGDP